MLILTRRYGEEIQIGNNADIVVLGVKGQQVRLGIKAPSDQVILCKELTNQNALDGAS